eukprot:gene9434-1640_t
MNNLLVFVVLTLFVASLNALAASSASSGTLSRGCGDGVPNLNAIYKRTLTCNNYGVCVLASTSKRTITEEFGQCYVQCALDRGENCYRRGKFRTIYFKASSQQEFDSKLVPFLNSLNKGKISPCAYVAERMKEVSPQSYFQFQNTLNTRTPCEVNIKTKKVCKNNYSRAKPIRHLTTTLGGKTCDHKFVKYLKYKGNSPLITYSKYVKSKFKNSLEVDLEYDVESFE